MKNWIVAASLALFLPSCESSDKQPETKGERNAVFEDVPAPDGFDYVEGYGNRNPTFRSYKQVYRGQRKPEEVLGFYRDKMMKFHGWTLGSETGAVPETVVISFTKKSERCDIEVKSDAERRTIVTVTLKLKE